jgi:hypothetical protein
MLGFKTLQAACPMHHEEEEATHKAPVKKVVLYVSATPGIPLANLASREAK